MMFSWSAEHQRRVLVAFLRGATQLKLNRPLGQQWVAVRNELAAHPYACSRKARPLRM